MTSEIRPALTPEEWARPESEIDIACGVVWAGLGGVTTGDLEARGEAPPHLNLAWQTVQDEIAVSRRHALAALALHGLVVDGRPVGFTREDVGLLRGELYGGFVRDDPRLWEKIGSLSDRIAALLPPEAK
jgi:hypothetical protein